MRDKKNEKTKPKYEKKKLSYRLKCGKKQKIKKQKE